jgi:tocopherol cyclase
MLIKRFNALFNPGQYHGWGRTRRHFEGWYYKVVSKAEDSAFAFIPGIAMNERGEKQAFVQVLDGKRLTAEYHKYAASDFHPEPGKFELRISGNYFSGNRLLLDLPGIKGELHFIGNSAWPSKWFSPGIMGPYSFVPFMECYHGVISMDHHIEGHLIINNETVDFTGGKGYIEKDWGSSFPGAYIWLQSNHFKLSETSLKVSVAKIPWLGTSFTGFIAGLLVNGRLFRFTTYNSTHLIKSFADDRSVELIMENKQYRIEINATRNNSTQLASPISGFMDGRISESMTDLVDVRLSDKISGEIIFHDTGRNAGLEVAGNIPQILTG